MFYDAKCERCITIVFKNRGKSTCIYLITQAKKIDKKGIKTEKKEDLATKGKICLIAQLDVSGDCS